MNENKRMFGNEYRRKIPDKIQKLQQWIIS